MSEIPQKIKDDMTAVLQEYANLGVIGRACDNAGVPRGKHKEWMEKYPVYKERFEEVRAMFVDGLELIAIERAKEKSDSINFNVSPTEEIYGDKAIDAGIGQIHLCLLRGC